MSLSEPPSTAPIVSVPMGRWAIASAPTLIRTLLGSCAGVVLYDRTARVGGIAHIVLPTSRGTVDHPGKFADTAIPAMLGELEKSLGRQARARLTAKVVGGASMFQSGAATNIGRLNHDAVEVILADLGIRIVARDVGGETGRRVVLDTGSGALWIRIPGGADYQI